MDRLPGDADGQGAAVGGDGEGGGGPGRALRADGQVPRLGAGRRVVEDEGPLPGGGIVGAEGDDVPAVGGERQPAAGAGVLELPGGDLPPAGDVPDDEVVVAEDG